MAYRYEYGKRWNERLPRNDIKFLVNRMHCGTDDDTVANEILIRCEEKRHPCQHVVSLHTLYVRDITGLSLITFRRIVLDTLGRACAPHKSSAKATLLQRSQRTNPMTTIKTPQMSKAAL
jgi:hypothetical protein